MMVGLMEVELRIGWANSLKDKRSEVKSLINRVRSKFNVSIAEVGYHDDWRRALLGIAAISAERRQVDSITNEVTKFIEQSTEAEIISCKIEIL